LAWDVSKKFLFSGSYDKTIICWDIGGQKGTTYDLEGHKDRVDALLYVPLTRQLLSGSQDSHIVVWDMNARRKENPQWKESDVCEHCKKPFFWNVKMMWEQKTVGKRQHHCRRCGAAICDECSKNRSSIPAFGHEFQVRICNQCTSKITDDE
jgi:WD40 repeat protein